MFDRLFAKELDDNSLIEKAKNSESAFAEVYDRFAGIVYRFVRRRVSTDQDAEDIVSDTFMAVAARIQDYDLSKWSKFTTRLLSITNHKLQDHLRKIYNEHDIYVEDEMELWYENNILDSIQSKQIYDAIITFIKQLPDRQISIFSLKHIEWFQNKEIAEICSIDERTVSSTLSIVSKKVVSHLEALHYM